MKKFLILMLIALCTISASTEELVNEAKLHLNKPYHYTASGPNAFDCSGLVYHCYQTIYDIELPRTAYEQGYNTEYSTINNISDLQIGDIVFFDTNRGDSDKSDHSGIYMGNGNFIHASSAKGKVIISTLLKGYYNERFSWGKRIKEE